MGNEEMEKSQERGEEGKDMLNGVGGLEIWWRLVAHPDESRQAPWKKRGGYLNNYCRKVESVDSTIGHLKKSWNSRS